MGLQPLLDWPSSMMPPRRWLQRLYHQVLVPHAAEDDDQSTSPKTRAGQLDYPTSIEHPVTSQEAVDYPGTQ